MDLLVQIIQPTDYSYDPFCAAFATTVLLLLHYAVPNESHRV